MMDTYHKFLGWMFSVLIGIVTFFLWMFYNKVDTIDKNLQTIITQSAVKDEQLRSIESRLTALEKAIQLTNKNNLP